jgi:hypothetical protein
VEVQLLDVLLALVHEQQLRGELHTVQSGTLCRKWCVCVCVCVYVCVFV